jgi:hypothetical protein
LRNGGTKAGLMFAFDVERKSIFPLLGGGRVIKEKDDTI